jgi:ABC-type uncharacterized transport system involved in gliding motility auxiliary subunit
VFGLRRLPALYRSRRARSQAALVCIALLLIATNVLAARYLPQRLDLTAEHLYTLSPGTRLTLGHIDEPITLRFYYSPQLGERLPSYRVYAQRVREMLDQYVAAAQGKLRPEIEDPLPFSDVEDRAVAAGLQGVPLDAQGEQVYFGLSGTNSTDDRQTIAFFSPQRERFLEYDLTRLVHALAFPKRTVVGLISSLPLAGNPAAIEQGQPLRPMAVLNQLREVDDVQPLPEALDAIPAGTDVLMLVQPQRLPDKTLFAIDQFVLRGGKALVFVDPYSEFQARDGTTEKTVGSDLEPLFKAWGLKLLPDQIAADRRDARRVGVPNGAGGEQTLEYVAWLDLSGERLNRNDVITADLRHVTVASAGILEPLKGATTKFEPLITTSRDAMTLPATQVAGLPDVAGLLAHFRSEDRSYVLAAHLTGPADTAFPDGPPNDDPKDGKAMAPFERKSVRPINVVVVADTDLLDDRFWVQSQEFFGRQVVVPVANNGDFVANAIDSLAGGEDLIGLRSRGTAARPFDLVEHIQRAADARYAAEQRALEQKLKETQAKLHDLTEGRPADDKAELAPAQARAVEQFRADMLATRRQLRTVQAALRRDIGNLQAIIEFADIALVPIIVAAAALVLAALRSRRRRSAA